MKLRHFIYWLRCLMFLPLTLDPCIGRGRPVLRRMSTQAVYGGLVG